MHPSNRIRDVRLVGTDDAGYRAAGAEGKLRSMHLGAKVEPSAVSRLSTVLEPLARNWIGERVPLARERVLAYDEQRGAFAYRPFYRALDAVAGTGDEPQAFFEVKVSGGGMAVLRARAQVGKSARVARHRWRDVNVAVVLVALAPLIQPPDSPFPGVRFFTADDDWPGHLSKPDKDLSDTPCVVLHVEDLVSWANRKGHAVPPGLLAEALAEANDLARLQAARDSLRAAGVPQTEWPAEVFPVERIRAPAPPARFGEPSSESPFAGVLRRALGRSDEK